MTYTEIVDKINEAKEAYYNSGSPIMSDWEYDQLLAKSEKLGYIEKVGAAPADNINKIKHEHPMLSLAKCHSVEEIEKFINGADVLAMDKADGLTCSATYIDGVLTRLETRGDGEVGNDIMFHAKSFENLPLYINKPGKYVIDGECVILWSDFDKINSELPEAEQYSHPRNLAAGSLNQLDPNISKQRHLRFYAWDVIEGGKQDNLMDNLYESDELGFDTVNFIRCGVYNLDNIVSLIRREAEDDRFPIDGVVFKYNDIAYGKSLGRTGHHFRAGIAYKYQDDCYPTKLKSITWQVGKTKIITPVANFEPVDIGGVIVEKASLHNISIMKQLGITNGCTCYIKRANDVVPQVDHCENDGNGEIAIPNICPECGHPTYIDRSGKSEVLCCSNDDCPAALLARWQTFVSKKGMDIAGLSEQTLDRFLKLGFLDHVFVNLYHLDGYRKDLYKLDGFGKKSIDNLLDAIEASRDVDLEHFIVAFSIPNIGTGQAKLLAKRFKTFDAFRDACDNDFRFDEIPSIGPILNTNIHHWWSNNDWQMLDVAQEVRFKEKQTMNKPEGSFPLLGKTFVVTGTVNHFKNRDELQKKIEDLGGNVVGSVSKNTSYLINNDTESTSSKNKKAKELGVPIISEEDFLKIIY